MQAGRGHRGAGVDVDDTDAMSGAFSLIGCESRRPGWEVAEKHLRDRVVVVGNGVRALWDESMGSPAARGGDRSPAMQAWYFP